MSWESIVPIGLVAGLAMVLILLLPRIGRGG